VTENCSTHDTANDTICWHCDDDSVSGQSLQTCLTAEVEPWAYCGNSDSNRAEALCQFWQPVPMQRPVILK